MNFRSSTSFQDLSVSKALKDLAIKRFGAIIKDELRRVEESKNVLIDAKNSSCLTSSDLADIEAQVHLLDGKNLIVKGSRFTHSEKLQSAEAAASVELPSSSLEEVGTDFSSFKRQQSLSDYFLVR